MNKAGIADAVHVVVGGTKTTAEQAVEKVIETIISSLKKRRRSFYRRTGHLFRQAKSGQTGAKPENGEAISVPAMKVPKFKASKNLKDSVK